jgi:hypothetical protein
VPSVGAIAAVGGLARAADTVTDAARAADTLGDTVGAAGRVDDLGAAAAKFDDLPPWRRRLMEGQEFNRQQAGIYAYDEVRVRSADGSRYYVVDSYDPDLGEIVSRKHTQLGDVQEPTARSYLNELAAEYSPGARIDDTPRNRDLGIAGQRLDGDLVLEVPVQTGPVPQPVLNLADELGIIIRDVNGGIYNP